MHKLLTGSGVTLLALGTTAAAVPFASALIILGVTLTGVGVLSDEDTSNATTQAKP